MKWLLVKYQRGRNAQDLTNEDPDYSKHKFQTVNTELIVMNHFYILQRKRQKCDSLLQKSCL